MPTIHERLSRLEAVVSELTYAIEALDVPEPVSALLTALDQREILDDNRIRVSFVETVFILFGTEVKRSPAKGTGVWEQLYVEKSPDGSARLRVMRTPSLFVLRQKVA